MRRWKKKGSPTWATSSEIEAAIVGEDDLEAIAAWCGGVAIEEIDPFDSNIRYPAINLETMGRLIRVHADTVIWSNGPGMYHVDDIPHFRSMFDEVPATPVTRKDDPFDKIGRVNN